MPLTQTEYPGRNKGSGLQSNGMSNNRGGSFLAYLRLNFPLFFLVGVVGTWVVRFPLDLVPTIQYLLTSVFLFALGWSFNSFVLHPRDFFAKNYDKAFGVTEREVASHAFSLISE